MTPERWQQVREVLGQVLDLPPEDRTAFLDRACSHDASLRQEVETLLSSDEDVRSSFLAMPPLPSVLSPGTRLGDYEVRGLVGVGGMGEVYRARDERLGREVAIKVLPPLLATDSDRLWRFEQEARAAAALSHPNILAVFQMGTHEGAPYLVSELLEGESLREQIKRGRAGIRKAVDYGAQIVRGLAAAHEKGIIHRDLKPENLFVTKEGRVKILDFGLAKLTQRRTGLGAGPQALTEGTEAGTVMGTAGYMSPEQVRGQAVDHRTDIFSFGAVLYEMLSGKRAFQKATSPETMSAILNEEPPTISQIATNIAPALERVVQRCLEKNPEQRFQSASDLAFALDALSDPSGKSYPAAAVATPTFIARHWKVFIPATVVLLALSVGGYFYFHRKPKLTDKDTIVLSDFANSSGDAVFDDALKMALTVSLQQSPFLNVLPDSKVTKTLQQMTLPAGTKLTPEVTREVCQREDGKAYVAGSIGSLGSEYVVGLKAVNCQSGDTLAQEQVTAASKEKVLDALGDAATRLRGELGESLASVQKYDVPLFHLTTSSLEALKAYTLGAEAYQKNGEASVPYMQRAIELDPNFAMAYSSLGRYYTTDVNEYLLAKGYLTKAFDLRDHASEFERMSITFHYYVFVTGELYKAQQALQEGMASYPQIYGGTGTTCLLFGYLGQFEKALDCSKAALKRSPDALSWYANVAKFDYMLQHFDAAEQDANEELKRGADDSFDHWYLYLIAFQKNNSAAMAEQQKWFAGRPEEYVGLGLASDVEGYEGHVLKMRELARRAADSARRAGMGEVAATYPVEAALYEAAYGDVAEARNLASAALRMEPHNPDVQIGAALAFAMNGEEAKADSLAQGLAKNFPLDTQMQLFWLPAIRAQLALNHKNPTLALNDLQPALPIELGDYIRGDQCRPYIYIRGEAYLTAGQGAAAAVEFQKLLDHSGLVDTCYTRALAHLGVARANALEARTLQGADADAAHTRALAAYQDFLALWKDADPDIPVLKQAKGEYAKLR